MDDHIEDILLKLALALLVGTIIGAEREYKNKSAGLRTLVLICLGSALFTIVSQIFGDDTEKARIASNIVTGIGFLGAGAIMREGLTVSGLTTASTIWVTAALGMVIGAGEFYLAIFATAIVMIVLTLFGYIQPFLEKFMKVIELRVTFEGEDSEQALEKIMSRYRLRFKISRTIKKKGNSVFYYEISGKKGELNRFLKDLNDNPNIKSFEY